MTLADILSAIGSIRYGVPTAEKERLAISGALPGAPEDSTAEQAAANRYASGYLFAKQHPTLAPVVQPLVDRLKTSDLPLFGGETPEAQSYASQGVTRALMDLENADTIPAGATLADLLR